MALIGKFVQSLNYQIETPIRKHLINVYGCLTIISLIAALGSYTHIYTNIIQAGILTSLAAVGFLVTLSSTRNNGKNIMYRLGLLLGFAFFSGTSLGPLLEICLEIDPKIIVTALTGSTLVFTSYSIAALTSKRRKWLYLGGTLITFSIVFTLLLFLNIFFKSQIIYQAYLYSGLLLMCGFILYDTQLIIEKRYNGDCDFIMHSIELFFDLIGIFRYILLILLEKERQKKSNCNKKDKN